MNRNSGKVGSVTLAALALVIPMGLAACGGGDDGDSGSGSVDLASGLPSAAVCNGEPSEVNPPASDPASGYAYINGGDGWSVGWNEVFGDQGAIVGDDATMILCVTVTESTEVDRCAFEEDGDQFELVLVDATYSYSLRNADTANEIARGTASGTADGCPSSSSWTVGESERIDYPAPTEGDLADAIEIFFG